MVSSEYTEVVKGFKVKKAVFDRLYDYQVDGIKWLYKLFVQEAGGILADDMGLGKTIQTIALLSSLLYFDKIKSVLIVAPSTLLINWGKEFRSWAPDVKVFKFDGSVSSNVRLRALENVQRNGGVLLTTYDLCRNYADTFSQCDWRQFIWDYFILDEGHKIKNPTKTTKAIYNIPSRHRLVITGTPVQNKLKELWALYDFAMKGTLLGTYRSFKMRYEDPITKGLSKDAMMKDMIKANKIAENLRQIYEPYFLRREKQEIFNSNRDLKLKLPIKIDWVVWIRLTQEQINVYRDFIALDSIKELILRENKKSIFLHILTLKKICDHLRLLSKNVCEQLLSKNDSLSENEMEKIIEEDQMVNIEVPDEILIAESGKLAFCLDLLEELKEKNHRVLLFSQKNGK
ncbi:hypothetical protein B4U79_09646 [Dinothrombium tinctorium]|uniref:Helicase ATP-binding domain-containing protein n=1 Tax=Dinothrombium tinctorium TaxID=1965070 RepID=A0A443QIR8_9ACAR|nr:hypothetical protein B4U79_09646 [Dinothrombium tinctorium]